jgi:small-conductance mechanosensitive channel
MFKELYYWMYKAIKKNKFNKDPELNAFFLFSSFEIMNIVTFLGIINYFLDLFITRDTVVIFGFIFSVSIMVINFIFLYRKRSEIIKRMETYTSKRKLIGKLLFVIYILATLFLMFYVMHNFVPVRY